VFYQPTPTRHICDFIGRNAPDKNDALSDLGSGRGHVPLLAANCTGARCIGNEGGVAYEGCVERCARALNLRRVEFLRQDARLADLSAGNVFYLYITFTGAMLHDVLNRLKVEAAKRPIPFARWALARHRRREALAGSPRQSTKRSACALS